MTPSVSSPIQESLAQSSLAQSDHQLAIAATLPTPTVSKDLSQEVPTKEQSGLDQAVVDSRSGRWQVFVSTFVTIFLAELGDKTQITTLLMTAESHAPWVVFIGAAAALVTTSLLGVLVGQWLAQRVPAIVLDRAAGVALLVVAMLLLLDIIA